MCMNGKKKYRVKLLFVYNVSLFNTNYYKLYEGMKIYFAYISSLKMVK